MKERQRSRRVGQVKRRIEQHEHAREHEQRQKEMRIEGERMLKQ